MSLLNEDLMKTNLDIPEGEIKIDGAVNPVYADAINVHNKKKKEIEKTLKDKKPELKKPFLGTKGNTTIIPKTKDMKKLKLAEDMFRPVRESMVDAPEAYEGIFRVIDNMEHIINYISELSDEELCYEDMQQSYNVLDDAMIEFSGYLEELRRAERAKKESLEEATAVMDRKSTKPIKDIWDDIYAELVGVKSIEASRRRLDRTPSQRYPADYRNEGPRVGMSRYEDALVVKADELSQLDFGKEVAETYGVEWRVKEHTSMYADSKYELLIYPFKPVISESLVESVDNEVYSAVAKYYDYGAPSNFIEVIADLVDRALLNKKEGYDVDDAVMDAIDSGLIYHKDIWTIKSGYEDSILSDEAYEQLRNDLYSIVDSFEDEEIDEGLTRAQRHNRNMDRIFQDKKDRDTRMSKFLKDNSDITDDELKKVQDDDKVGLELKNRGLHDRYWNEVEGKNESLKESYTKVDTIECGADTYRVVGGGFNTRDALVSVEDNEGNTKRLSSGDVVEFYTWYDKEGNVIHEPSDDNLDEAVCNYIENYDGFMIYECDGKYSTSIQDVTNPKINTLSGNSVEELKKKIDALTERNRKYLIDNGD